MKAHLTIFVLINLLITSCEKDNGNFNFDIGEGFEIYTTVTPFSHNLDRDYSAVNFDTILLLDVPVLRYNDLRRYDTLHHKLTLGISHDSIVGIMMNKNVSFFIAALFVEYRFNLA